MTGNAQHIIQHLFKADSLEDISVKQINDLRDRYPFFNLGHYLLSKKLYAQKADNFLHETKKTALYFSNPFWLQWLLQNAVDEKSKEPKAISVHEEIKEQIITNDKPISVAETDSSLASTNVEEIKNEPVAANIKEDELVFNPYHTVDYFASLGIKLSLDENPNDKFGKQLKSFTDWLKTMKKLPQKNAEPTSDTAAQASVEGFAAHSLQEKEIITEAMAEVLRKQGKSENAIELYRKLSLINPGKSAYFADKIEQLKEH